MAVPASTPAIEAARYPIVIHGLDGFMTAHSASFEAVRDRLPSDALHPIRLPDGRALLTVAFYRKHAGTAGIGGDAIALPPYAELAVSAMVTRRPLPRLVAALALAGLVRRRFGGVPLLFPMTNAMWRDAIKSELGLPVFLADFDLDLTGSEWRLRISDGQPLLRMTVRPSGRLSSLDLPSVLYGAVGGRLVAATCDQSGIGQRSLGGGTCELETGHPAMAGLLSLEMSRRSLGTIVYHSGRVVLRSPRDLGDARPIHAVRELGSPGRLIVRYPGLGSIGSESSIRPSPADSPREQPSLPESKGATGDRTSERPVDPS